ncbi:MAG: hypothetical protein KDD44_11270, partial [Bdellovibrionales bacterium]|nr:hypothetical protein [Bdellovibrionales bacterium]
MSRQNASGDRGAVIVIVAVFLILLMWMVAFAVDGSLMVTNEQQKKREAEAAAFAAVDGWSRTTGLHMDRMLVAQKRAQKILERSEAINNFRLENPNYSIDLPLTKRGEPLGEHGGVYAVRWWSTPDTNMTCSGADQVPCPCDSIGGNWNGPCAQILDYSSTSDKPNGFKVVWRTSVNNPIKNLFSSISGHATSMTESHATAVIQSTDVVLLLDVSRSSGSDNFAPVETYANAGQSPMEPSFKLNTSVGTCNAASIANPYPTDALTPPGAGTFLADRIPGQNAFLYRMASPGGGFLPDNRDVGWTSNVRHAKSDYGCYAVSYEEGGVATTEDILYDSYLAEISAGQPLDYYGPEPLGSFIYGVREAMRVMSESSAPYYVSLVSFDHNADVSIRNRPLMPAVTTDSE